MKISCILTALLLIMSAVANAQPGLDEMQQAQQLLTRSFFSAMDCSYVIAGIFAFFGALRIHHNWQMGHPRIDEAVAGWVFAMIFIVLAGAFLQAVFGI